MFLNFLVDCREKRIKVPIIPGLYIPRSFEELNTILQITKVHIIPELYQEFESRKDDFENFQQFSLNWMVNLINDVQMRSPEHISGYHFFTLNHFEMVQKLIQLIEFHDSKNMFK